MKKDVLATYHALRDPTSAMSLTVAAFLKERMLIKLRHLNVPGLDDIQVQVCALNREGDKDVVVEANAFRNGQVIGNATRSIPLILPEPSQKEINTRIHGNVIYQMCAEIRESHYFDAPLVLDTIFYRHLLKWLTPAQILNMAYDVHHGQFVIKTAYDEQEVVEKIKINSRGYCMSGRFNLAPGVAYDHGEVFIAGAMPRTLAVGLEGQPLNAVVEAELFEDAGTIKMVAAQKSQLRLVIDRTIISTQDIDRQAQACTRPITHIIEGVKR